jgi:hypothetical protein
MPRSSPDSTSGRSPDSPNHEVHLTPGLASMRVGDVRPDRTLHIMGKGPRSESCRSAPAASMGRSLTRLDGAGGELR